jgi:hypothetical protein
MVGAAMALARELELWPALPFALVAAPLPSEAPEIGRLVTEFEVCFLRARQDSNLRPVD